MNLRAPTRKRPALDDGLYEPADRSTMKRSGPAGKRPALDDGLYEPAIRRVMVSPQAVACDKDR